MACLQESGHNIDHMPIGDMDGGSVSLMGSLVRIEEKEKILSGETGDSGACRMVDEGTQIDKRRAYDKAAL